MSFSLLFRYVPQLDLQLLSKIFFYFFFQRRIFYSHIIARLHFFNFFWCHSQFLLMWFDNRNGTAFRMQSRWTIAERRSLWLIAHVQFPRKGKVHCCTLLSRQRAPRLWIRPMKPTGDGRLRFSKSSGDSIHKFAHDCGCTAKEINEEKNKLTLPYRFDSCFHSLFSSLLRPDREEARVKSYVKSTAVHSQNKTV